MNRVLFVDQFAGMGGGQRILHDIVHFFACEDIECAVALPHSGQFTEILQSEGVPTFTYSLFELKAGPKRLGESIGYFKDISRCRDSLEAVIAEFEPDLVFCNGPRCTLPTVLAASRTRVPVICAVHLIFSGKERMLLNWCFNRNIVRAITFCSALAADPFKGVVQRKAALVGNWVSPHFLVAPRTDHAKELFGFESQAIVVGVVGRISKNKGQALFLEALLPLLDEAPHLHLAIAGSADHEDPVEEERLGELVKAHPNAARVHMFGHISNSMALMDALDILVIPSLWEEPFGLVAVEGMARRLPIVATRSGELCHIVRSGESGFLVEKNASDIRHAVHYLLNHPIRAKEMGDIGQQIAATAYGPQPRLEALLQLSRSVVSNQDE